MLLMQIRFAVLTLLLATALAGCQSSRVATKGESIRVSDDVTLEPIAPGIWVYTTYFNVPDRERTGANGLVVIDGEDAVLINLPWTDAQTAALFDWVAQNSKATVRAVVPTHFHQDCMGGLAEAHRRGANSYGLDKTIALARQDHLPVPQCPFKLRTAVRCGTEIILLAYPGAGHTTDNIVAWLPKQRVLFGGCLIKSLNEQSLGNTSDGDLAAYPATLNKVKAAYRNAKIIVPGHGDWGGPELIDHTLKLCSKKSAQ
jgi:metallo-beta-lactamase class B